MYLYEVFIKYNKENYKKDLEKNQDFEGSKYVWNNKSVSCFSLYLDLNERTQQMLSITHKKTEKILYI